MHAYKQVCREVLQTEVVTCNDIILEKILSFSVPAFTVHYVFHFSLSPNASSDACKFGAEGF